MCKPLTPDGSNPYSFNIFCLRVQMQWTVFRIIWQTPRSKVILHKRNVPRSVNKFLEFYGIRSLTTVYDSQLVFLSWARSIQSMPSPIPCVCILILSSHLHLGLPSSLLPSGFPHQYPLCTSPLPRTCHISHPSHSSRFGRLNDDWWGV